MPSEPWIAKQLPPSDSEEEEGLRVRITEDENVDELTSTYFLILRYSMIICCTFLLTFYIPQLVESFQAVDWKLEQDPLWDGSYSDAFWYGNWYQKKFPEESYYLEIFAGCMVVFILQCFYYAWKSEKYFAWLFKDFTSYKDLSLEFKHMPKEIDSEREIKEFFGKIAPNGVKEVSCVYDLSEIFENECELKAKEDQFFNRDQTKALSAEDMKVGKAMHDLRDKQIQLFHMYEEHGWKFFDGRGFVTFNTQKAAWLTKDIWNKSVGCYIRSSLIHKW